MKRATLVSAACAAVFAAAGGCQFVEPKPAPTIFEQMDANHDGKLSRAEFSAGFADAMLTVYNLGPAGTLTPAQWEAVERGGKNGSFQRLDANHDGRLSRAELSSGQERDRVVNAMFDRVDKNHDGVISVEEGRPSGLDRTPQERTEGNGLQ